MAGVILIGVRNQAHNTHHLDGKKFETHWYKNGKTGQRVEPKTIVEYYLRANK